MASPKAETTQPLSVEIDGVAHTGHVVISGTRKLQFVVHYAGLSQGDGRDWGTDAEERHNMMCMAEAMLVQLVSQSQEPRQYS